MSHLRVSDPFRRFVDRGLALPVIDHDFSIIMLKIMCNRFGLSLSSGFFVEISSLFITFKLSFFILPHAKKKTKTPE